MDSVTLYDMAGSAGLESYFTGVFPADWMRKPSKYPACLIANTDDSTRGGEHWVAFNFPDAQTLEYFDSYGYTPYIYPLFNRFIINVIRPKKLVFNEMSVQSKQSQTCGLHCLYFLIKRYNGKSFSMIMNNEYSTNKCLNDCIVMEYFHRHRDKTTKRSTAGAIQPSLICQTCVCKSKFVF